MNTQRLQGLLQEIQAGDKAAATRLQRLLQPVVTHAVRNVLQTGDYSSPVGRQVRNLLSEAGDEYAPLGPGTLARLAQAICGQTLAQLRAPGRPEALALETVLA